MAMINPNQLNNYSDWRLLVERQKQERDKLERIISEKRDAHTDYRKAHKRYRGLCQEQDDQTLTVINLIPK